ncbi:hypothetical protein V500_10355, partial [Pseudogymnoascus sp. VKM F-4518 (FW-2643)]
RYRQHTDIRLLRFSNVFKRGKAAAELNQKTFDFSDTAKDQGKVARKEAAELDQKTEYRLA